MIPFSQPDLDRLYNTVRDAIQQVKSPDDKTQAEIDGVIYTNMRRELAGDRGSLLFNMFKRRRKFATTGYGNPNNEYGFYLQLVERMKMEHLRGDANEEDIKDLRLSLSEMRSAQSTMDRAIKAADQVAEKLIVINKTLNPHGDEDERETK